MTASYERNLIRLLHLVLSIPILGYLYGPVSSIPQAAWFTRWIAMPLVALSGFWLWLKPRLIKRLRHRQGFRVMAVLTILGGLALLPSPHATAQSATPPLHVGDSFPLFSARTLTGKTLSLPSAASAASGQPSIVVLTFTRLGGKDGRAWNQRLLKDFPSDLPIYTLMNLESAPRIFRSLALSEIKSGMPQPMQDRAFVLYQDEKLWRRRLAVTKDDRAFVLLLTPDGHIFWRNQAAFTEAEYLRLKTTIASP
jgi:hypothetical protein